MLIKIKNNWQFYSVYNQKKKFKYPQDIYQFLDEITTELLSSRDLRIALQKVVELSIPYLANLSFILFKTGQGDIERVTANDLPKSMFPIVEEVSDIYEEIDVNLKKHGEFGVRHIENLDPVAFGEYLKTIHPKMYELLYEKLGMHSYVGLPLIVKGEVIGLYALIGKGARVYTEEDIALAQKVAKKLSVVLSNVRLCDKVKKEALENKSKKMQLMRESEKKWSFLAEASKILASSIEFNATLQCVAKLAVPDIADWCSVYLRTERGLEQVAFTHIPSEKLFLLERQYQKHLDEKQGPIELQKVMRTGKTAFFPEVTDDVISTYAKDEEEYTLLKNIPLSCILVPLLVKKSPTGVLVLLSAKPERRYKKEDVILAEELASRAALAIENARLYRESQRAIAMRDEFMSITSHELRTPITSVKMYAQFLKRLYEKTADKGLLDYFERMDRQVDKMSTLINDLSHLSRIERGKFEYVMDRFSLDDEVKETVNSVQATTDNHQIIIEGKIGEKVYGDRDRIGQVLTNLLTNAIKYSPRADKVIVKLIPESPQKKCVTVRIQDFGVGISKHDMKGLFQPFYRIAEVYQSPIALQHYAGNV